VDGASAALVNEDDVHVFGQRGVEGGKIAFRRSKAGTAGTADEVEQDTPAFVGGEGQGEGDVQRL